MATYCRVRQLPVLRWGRTWMKAQLSIIETDQCATLLFSLGEFDTIEAAKEAAHNLAEFPELVRLVWNEDDLNYDVRVGH